MYQSATVMSKSQWCATRITSQICVPHVGTCLSELDCAGSSSQGADPAGLGSCCKLGLGLPHMCVLWSPGGGGEATQGKHFCGNGRSAGGKGLGWDVTLQFLPTCIGQSTSNGQGQRKGTGKYPPPCLEELASYIAKGLDTWESGESGQVIYSTTHCRWTQKGYSTSWIKRNFPSIWFLGFVQITSVNDTTQNPLARTLPTLSFPYDQTRSRSVNGQGTAVALFLLQTSHIVSIRSLL